MNVLKTILMTMVPLLLACGGRGVQRQAVPSRPPAVAETVEFLRRASVFALHTGVDSVDGSTYQELAYNRLPGEEDGLWEQVLDDGTVLVWTLETLHLKVRKRPHLDGRYRTRRSSSCQRRW